VITQGMRMIEFSELSKNYGAFRALAPLTLTAA
jgi:hypothetical protein